MKTLRTYGNLNEAFLAQAWLDSCGIATLIPDENTASGALPHVSIYSGIRLQVAEEDFDRAVVLMRDFAASPTEGLSEEAGPVGDGKVIVLSRSAARALFVLDLFLLTILFLQSTFFPLPLPADFEKFLSGTYISYPGAMLSYSTYYPLLLLYFIAGLSLVFFQNWGRYLYAVGWGLDMFFTLFGTANVSHGLFAFLGLADNFLGGFICCLIFFTPVANYFKRDKSLLPLAGL